MTTTPPSPPIETLKAACAQHERYLRGRLRGLGVAESALDDAVQDVFEVLVRRIGCYDSRFTLRQWMAGVARKIARRHRERMGRAPESIDEARVASPGADPEGWAARQEALASLQEFLGGLDPDRWAVFVLAEIEGLRGTEIAAELGVNLSTVYARLRAAKDSFERAMARRRRAERRSWLLLPMFGGSSSRALGSAAFMTPIALLGVLTVGGGAALGVRGCAGANEGSASEARANEGSASEGGAGRRCAGSRPHRGSSVECRYVICDGEGRRPRRGDALRSASGEDVGRSGGRRGVAGDWLDRASGGGRGRETPGRLRGLSTWCAISEDDCW